MPFRLRPLALLALLLAAACASGQRAADFTLVDTSGAPWRLSQQRGKALLLTFGYTHCADTCPATLAKLVRIRVAIRRACFIGTSRDSIAPATAGSSP
jgi:protein SCO1/2